MNAAFMRPIERTSPHPYLLLDSGAFSLFKSGKRVVLSRYEAYVSRWKGYLLAAVNFDVIPGGQHGIATRNETEDASIQSYERWLRLRKLCVEVLPVFHQSDRPEWLYRYLDEGAQYIGISPSDHMTSLARNQWLIDVHDHMACNGVALGQAVFTHVLGAFSPTSLMALKGAAWSADASTVMQHTVRRRLMVPTWKGAVSDPYCFDSYVPIYVGEREVPTVEGAPLEVDEIETYLRALGYMDHFERNGNRIVVPSIYVLASANLSIAHGLNRMTGVRAFIAGPDYRVMRQIVVEEQYPYILRTFADVTESAVRDYYYRALQLP